MKGTLKLLLAVTAVAVIAVVLAPTVSAQCVPARTFSARNAGGMDPLGSIIDSTGTTSEASGQGGGSAIGKIWSSQNSDFANNFNGQCPASIWYQQTAAGGCSTPSRCINGAVNGDVGTGLCVLTGCPVGPAAQAACGGIDCDMTITVEDTTPDGSDAFFLVWRVDSTLGSATADWDYRRLASGVNTFPIQHFPTAEVTGSARIVGGMNDGDVDAGLAYVDVALNFEGVTGAGNTPTPATDGIVSYDLVSFTGTADPGRLRSEWTPLDTRTYNNSSEAFNLTIPCMNTSDNTYLAVGVTFDGGTGADVPSDLVGAATIVECDPFLADPEQPRTIQERGRRATTPAPRGDAVKSRRP